MIQEWRGVSRSKLRLQSDCCTALKLAYVGRDRSFLADGSFIWTNTYKVTVAWDGKDIEVEVIGIESDPLLGMTMLEGYDVFMSVKENGVVRIQSPA